MSNQLSKDQIEDLLQYIGVHKIGRWKSTNINFCCPIHGESHPSCGINSDFINPTTHEHQQVFNCFSCGAHGNLAWFLYKSLPEEFKSFQSAVEFIQSRYSVEFELNYDSDFEVKRYEDFFQEEVEVRPEMPLFKLAPFKSGKETYQYFYDRGFTKEDVKEYMIGRDLVNETVTIPSFWEDGTPAGVIGRYIDPNRPKNSRFKIYEFPKGLLVYPLDKLEVINNTIIGVESMLDCIKLRKWGFKNSISIMGNDMSQQQSDQIADRCSNFIDLFDNDSGGEKGREIAKHRLGNRVLYLTVKYPNIKFGKDPSEWGEERTRAAIESASILGGSIIPRI